MLDNLFETNHMLKGVLEIFYIEKSQFGKCVLEIFFEESHILN